MYWCVRGSDHVLVCEGYRSCIGVGGVSIKYLCEGYRSCIGVGGVSIMYWCVRGIDYVPYDSWISNYLYNQCLSPL